MTLDCSNPTKLHERTACSDTASQAFSFTNAQPNLQTQINTLDSTINGLAQAIQKQNKHFEDTYEAKKAFKEESRIWYETHSADHCKELSGSKFMACFDDYMDAGPKDNTPKNEQLIESITHQLKLLEKALFNTNKLVSTLLCVQNPLILNSCGCQQVLPENLWSKELLECKPTD